MPIFTRSFLVRLLATTAIVAIVAVIGIGIHHALLASEAEHCLHATCIVSGLVEDFVRTTNGDWPRSWRDLENQKPSRLRGGIFKWPQDAAKVRAYVTVDFDVDPAALAQSTPDNFDVIAPIGPCFASYNRNFPFIIEALREFHPVPTKRADGDLEPAPE